VLSVNTAILLLLHATVADNELVAPPSKLASVHSGRCEVRDRLNAYQNATHKPRWKRQITAEIIQRKTCVHTIQNPAHKCLAVNVQFGESIVRRSRLEICCSCCNHGGKKLTSEVCFTFRCEIDRRTVNLFVVMVVVVVGEPEGSDDS